MCHVYSKFANRSESSVVNNVMTHSGDQARVMGMEPGVHRFFCSFMALMPRYAKTIRLLGNCPAKLPSGKRLLSYEAERVRAKFFTEMVTISCPELALYFTRHYFDGAGPKTWVQYQLTDMCDQMVKSYLR